MYEFKLRSLISGWLILALLLVILLCHFAPVASAADIQMYLYNGVELPDINVVWTDKTKYPYAYIKYETNSYYVSFTKKPVTAYQLSGEDGPGFGSQTAYITYKLNSTSWVYSSDSQYNNWFACSTNINNYPIIWSNQTLTYSDGTNYLVASDPVPVDPGPSSAVVPVFTVEPPLITWVEYNVGDAASPVTVAAVVDDVGTISYTWYRTIYAESGSPSNVVFSTGSTLVPDTSVVSDSSYYCVATNTNGAFSQSAYSRAYRVKVVESGAADPPSETPTYPSAEDIGSSVGDAFQGVLDQLDINTIEQGNSFVDQLTDIIPNHSVGFLDALGGLIVSLGYTGTECVLTVPALVMPQIGDLVPQYTLLEKQTVDLESFFNMFPDFLVTLVQSLFTGGLIIFCFREFYFVISYVLTLRWRDMDE